MLPVEDDTTGVGCGNAVCPCKPTAILIRQKFADADAEARVRRRRAVELVAARRRRHAGQRSAGCGRCGHMWARG